MTPRELKKLLVFAPSFNEQELFSFLLEEGTYFLRVVEDSFGAQCQAALDRTKTKLQEANAWSWQLGANGVPHNSRFEIGKTNHPAHRQRQYIEIVLGEPGLINVGNSPIFMKNIAQEIIGSCVGIISVLFQQGYEWGDEFRLMPDGNVKKAECGPFSFC